MAVLPALRRPAAAMTIAAAAAACSIAEDEERIEGERIPILLAGESIEPDSALAGLEVLLPAAVVNRDWPQQGGNARHAMRHVALPADPAVAWRSDIGTGADDDAPLLSGPIVAEGRVYALDTEASVTARNFSDGRLVWRTDLEPRDERDGSWGGGLAYADGLVFAATGFGDVIALVAADGTPLWRTGVGGAMRAAPAAGLGRVFAVTKDNRLHVLDAGTGAVAWTHSGIAETAGLLGSSAPALGEDIVIVPYSSGELFALRAENGRVLWTDNLSKIRRVDAISAMADIRGRPVLDDARVYAVSHSGRMVAIDARSGRRLWEADIAGIEQPWVAGDFVFVVTTGGSVVCLTAQEGRILWTRQLEPVDRDTPVLWRGPVLAGGRLLVASDRARMVALSPSDGTTVDEWELRDGVPVAPVVADNTLILLTEDGDVQAWR